MDVLGINPVDFCQFGGCSSVTLILGVIQILSQMRKTTYLNPRKVMQQTKSVVNVKSFSLRVWKSTASTKEQMFDSEKFVCQ